MSGIINATIALRSFARRLGLTRPLGLLMRAVTGASRYEQRFGNALAAAARRGDHVWDVGANVGLYTAALSRIVGDAGSVCAFEPAPACCAAIEAMALPNARVFNLALGDAPGRSKLHLSADPLGSTHSLLAEADASAEAIDVRVATGDSILAEQHLPVPNIIKVDVEGYEEEVLSGMRNILRSPNCRAVFVEVHFATLEQRGRSQAPAHLQRFLQDCAFTVRWLDASHIGAEKVRPTARWAVRET